MSYYVIAVGGTGAKCVEALAHLCAAGLLSVKDEPAKEIYVLFVDPDKSNGSLARADIALSQYLKCKEIPLGKIDLFGTPITVANPNVWTPFKEDARPSLESFFSYETLKSNKETSGVAHLMDVLYSKLEMTSPLDEGFRGRPSIGAAVMASTVKLGEEEPWKTFREKIRLDIGQGNTASIVLLGSLFGGTGAAGIPTISRLIRDEFQAAVRGVQGNHGGRSIPNSGARLGAVLLLPYFGFLPVSRETLRADADSFLMGTQAALRYYHNQDYLQVFDAAYLLGEETLSQLGRASIGGKSQRNEPHVAELYAALACIDFLLRPEAVECQMIARTLPNAIAWEDLPGPSGAFDLRLKLGQAIRFAFAYLSVYFPMLDSINKGSKAYLSPWYVDFFERAKVALPEAISGDLGLIKDYCERLLLWWADIHSSCQNLKVNLVDTNAFSRAGVGANGSGAGLLDAFALGDFANLTLDRPSKDTRALTRLWERVSNSKVSDRNARATGKFIHALYQACREV
ncbi:MAG TPA: hypothetical protein VJX67_23560 [Blastocatellia bacterium]|nr:hypothetical protein [Blastocatellia bacterium]